VDEYGVVTAKGIGTATITATADGGISVKASCKITVGYGITYQLNGGKNHKSNPYVYTKNQTVTLKSPTRKGYSFKGWYTDRNFNNKITEILRSSKKSYTLYARWERN
jgi:endo-1,4-beta-xylanase